MFLIFFIDGLNNSAISRKVTWFHEMADFLNENVQLALAAVGGIVLIRFACSLVAFLYSTFLSGGVNVKKLGSWAVVTVIFGNVSISCPVGRSY